MGPRLRRTQLVGEIEKAIGRIGPLIKNSPERDIKPETVSEINTITAQMVDLIRSKAG